MIRIWKHIDDCSSQSVGGGGHAAVGPQTGAPGIGLIPTLFLSIDETYDIEVF